MKTQSVDNMKHTLLHFLEQLGVPLNYIINGLIGGFIWSIYKKEKFWNSVRQILIGGVVAGYCTPVVIAKTAMSSPYIGFTSFVIGMLGMVIIDSIYKRAIKWVKKFKKIEDIIKKD